MEIEIKDVCVCACCGVLFEDDRDEDMRFLRYYRCKRCRIEHGGDYGEIDEKRPIPKNPRVDLGV